MFVTSLMMCLWICFLFVTSLLTFSFTFNSKALMTCLLICFVFGKFLLTFSLIHYFYVQFSLEAAKLY